MTDCEQNSGLLMDYINRRLAQTENSRIVAHLTECPHCRNEAAKLIKIRDHEQSFMMEVPDDILQSAFDKLPQKERALNEVLHSGSCFMAFDLIRYSLSITQQTIQLARKAL